jgi:hypothetical protein
MSPAFRRVLLFSAALKIVLAIALADIEPRYDETEYAKFGQAIAQNGEKPVLWRAPGYQTFIAWGWSLAGGRFLGVRLLQSLISIATTIVVYRIGRRLWNERAGFAAGAFTAFYPTDVAFSHLLWSESLYGALVIIAFERLLRTQEDERGRGAAIAAGIAGELLGAATLTRSVGAALMAASLLWLMLRAGSFRSRVVLASALFSGWALLVLPYSIQASSRAGRFVLVDTNSGFNLWSGNNPRIPDDLASMWCLGLPLENGSEFAGPLRRYSPGDGWREEIRWLMAKEGIHDPDGPGGDTWFRREAFDDISRRPGEFLARVPKKVAAFWSPDFFLPRHLLRDWYGATPPFLAALITALTWITACIPLVLGPAALAVLPRSSFRSLAVTWTVMYIAVHAIAYGHSRMHAPLAPVLTLAVSGVVFSAGLRRMRRGIPWAALVLAMWIATFPILGGFYVMPGPRHAAVARAFGSLRILPFPGAKRLAWMQAGIEEAQGRWAEAERILEEPRFAEDPWTLFLRGRIALSRAAALPANEARTQAVREAAQMFDRALERDPNSFAALMGCLRSAEALENAAQAENCRRRAVEVRPWEAGVVDSVAR